jgi:DNA repair exonuclease SbcCD ATPase subunit
MKKILVFVFAAFLVTSCSKDATPPVAIPVAPDKKESVKPYVKKTQDTIDKSVVENVKINEKVKQQTETISQQKITIQEALLKVEQIKKELVDSKLKTEDVDYLINLLKQIEDKNKELVGKNKELFDYVVQQNTTLTYAKKNAQESYEKLVQKEQECDELRKQRDFLASNLENKNKEIADIQKDNTKLKEKLANANVYKYWGIAFVIVVVLVNIGLLYLRKLNPLQ